MDHGPRVQVEHRIQEGIVGFEYGTPADQGAGAIDEDIETLERLLCSLHHLPRDAAGSETLEPIAADDCCDDPVVVDVPAYEPEVSYAAPAEVAATDFGGAFDELSASAGDSSPFGSAFDGLSAPEPPADGIAPELQAKFGECGVGFLGEQRLQPGFALRTQQRLATAKMSLRLQRAAFLELLAHPAHGGHAESQALGDVGGLPTLIVQRNDSFPHGQRYRFHDPPIPPQARLQGKLHV